MKGEEFAMNPEDPPGDPDILVTESWESVLAKIRLAAEENRRTGKPSGCDTLLEDRRLERERELREEGW
jgi:hypothetical protein